MYRTVRKAVGDVQRAVLGHRAGVHQALEEGALALQRRRQPLGLRGRLVALDLVHPLPQAGEHRLGTEQVDLPRLADEERLPARLQRGHVDGQGVELPVELGLGDPPPAVEGDDRVLLGLPGGELSGQVGQLLGDILDLLRLGLQPLAGGRSTASSGLRA